MQVKAADYTSVVDSEWEQTTDVNGLVVADEEVHSENLRETLVALAHYCEHQLLQDFQ